MPKASLLIIEDDVSLRRVLEFSLEEAGYQVLTAPDGQAGLELFREARPPLVITDIAMPGMSGYEVLKTIKEESPETLVVVITAFGSVEKAVDAMKIGAYDYLTKPFGRDELRLVVAKALAFRGLQEENARLREELHERVDFSSIVGISEKMQQVFDMVRRVANTEATVLLLGESGTGKELVAGAIHHGSERAAGPLVPVNCAAIPHELLESELFGHVRGAFTGAVRDRSGKFAQADGGTLFLDEVGELPADLQPKLLRALQERVIEPVGGSPRKVDVRVVAATNLNLEEAVAGGQFREDLYYRLAVIPVYLPALRERLDDIPVLVRHFLNKHGGQGVRVSDALLRQLAAHSWPGNVRELENCVERMLILRRSDQLDVEDFRPVAGLTGKASQPRVLNLPEGGYALEDLEKEAVLEALRRCDGNQTRAAAFLRIPRHTLIYRMEKYGIPK
ncbi:sigma-54-dependent transcriptional regulator [Geoalkalibacter halelectricus]|uniref:Sigma-54 dependent transcriptional regulator n=1 Tax=Geoalkalibacter halelectricus TaxID=2847045 RepID=A0ABY5ZL93_9BACT|nr:sigma-54 dependent transcriptional regulator [Geoalkalibacter halelectricus]MDO3379604.1 sigma-54 dependent transcriptional regulator [Geoalkalibacter halelectricus]UWZ78580.1 sigma-54 dependent transcriptional regulator [Geoalkalibacter halelectricus]